MSEYVFPKVFKYTEGSGSGSGSGSGNLVPCTDCGFPYGTGIDTHYINTTAMVAGGGSAGEDCCPVVKRTKNCWNCGFYGGATIETHYIDLTAQVDVDAVGEAECCPNVLRPVDDDLVPCVNCGLPENLDPNNWTVDTSAKGAAGTPPECCPPKQIDAEGCDPPCSGDCQQCIDGECVDKDQYPCSLCVYENGSIFPPGTSSDTHYVDVGEKNCGDYQATVCCSVKPRDNNDSTQTTTIIDVPAGQITTSMPLPNLIKKGAGTLVLTAPPTVFPPICKLLRIEEGKCVLGPGVASSFTLTDTKIDFGPRFTCGFEISGNQKININSLAFGKDSSSTFSYTSNENQYYGKINVGFGGITIAENGLNKNIIRELIISGRGDGSWNGDVGFVTDKEINGIKNIGYVFNSDGSTTIAWASPGDTNLDGMIDILDVADILSSNKYDSGESAHWFEGDFNYDGIVDVLDISSFLASNLFDKGTYLPSDESYGIMWYHNGISNIDAFNHINLLLTTDHKYEPITSKTIGIPFGVTPTSKRIRKCEITTKLECNNKAQSIFTAGGNCNDSECDPTKLIPNPRSGACCLPNNMGCETVIDNVAMTAPDYCVGVLKGIWKGYSSTCVDQTCPITNDNKIIDIPRSTDPIKTKPTWGGCCISGTNRPTDMICVIVSDTPQVSKNGDGVITESTLSAQQLCQAQGGIFYGYGQVCNDTCYSSGGLSPNAE